jgi:hypothetical protein
MAILYDFTGNNRRLNELLSHLLRYRSENSLIYFFVVHSFFFFFFVGPERANKSDHAQCVYIECRIVVAPTACTYCNNIP